MAKQTLLKMLLGLLCVVGAAFAEETALKSDCTDKDGVCEVVVDGKPVLVYKHTQKQFKPYVQSLCSPSGVNVLRDNVEDHIHHHGLMFAVKADNVDFWSETPECGRMSGSEFKIQKSSAYQEAVAKEGENTVAKFVNISVLEHVLDWKDAEGKSPVLKEDRMIRVNRSSSLPCTLLGWETKLTTAEGKKSVALSGDHYMGLGMRFLKSMDAKGVFFNNTGEAGEVVRGAERNVKANWCAYSADADGKPVTVALFSAPWNERHPTMFFTMTFPFAYMSATLGLHKEPMNIEEGKPLRLCYGVAVWDGKQNPEEVEKGYQEWIDWMRNPDDNPLK